MIEKDSYRILVLSDTHEDYRRMNTILRREFPFDILIHCGDSQVSLDMALDLRDQYELFSVKGNCDAFSRDAELLTPRVGAVKLFIAHGHRYEVHKDSQRIRREALREGASVVIYGHTHRPVNYFFQEEHLLLLNPGSLMLPKQSPKIPTYAILKIARGAAPKAQIVECPEWA